MNKIYLKFINTKFGKFWDKAHLNYLLLGFILLGVKALLYFAIVAIANNGWVPVIRFNMAIDNAIPFIPYFYFFYVTYYFLPEIFLWILSFYNKRKFYDLFFGAVLTNILCCICFLIVNVQMNREPYEAIVAPYSLFNGSVNSFKTFWYACIHMQYNADAGGYNCFPSLHASFATMLILTGLPTLKKEKHFPIGCRITCVIFGVGILISTFFIKQHYFIDAMVGMAVMVVCYYLTVWLINVYLKRKANKSNNDNKNPESINKK